MNLDACCFKSLNNLLNRLGRQDSVDSFDEKLTECSLASSRAMRCVNGPLVLNSSLHNGLPGVYKMKIKLIRIKMSFLNLLEYH